MLHILNYDGQMIATNTELGTDVGDNMTEIKNGTLNQNISAAQLQFKLSTSQIQACITITDLHLSNKHEILRL
jgi:hypothetical protein